MHNSVMQEKSMLDKLKCMQYNLRFFCVFLFLSLNSSLLVCFSTLNCLLKIKYSCWCTLKPQIMVMQQSVKTMLHIQIFGECFWEFWCVIITNTCSSYHRGFTQLQVHKYVQSVDCVQIIWTYRYVLSPCTKYLAYGACSILFPRYKQDHDCVSVRKPLVWNSKSLLQAKPFHVYGNSVGLCGILLY